MKLAGYLLATWWPAWVAVGGFLLIVAAIALFRGREWGDDDEP